MYSCVFMYSCVCGTGCLYTAATCAGCNVFMQEGWGSWKSGSGVGRTWRMVRSNDRRAGLRGGLLVRDCACGHKGGYWLMGGG